MTSRCPLCSDTKVQPLGGFPAKPCPACGKLDELEFCRLVYAHHVKQRKGQEYADYWLRVRLGNSDAAAAIRAEHGAVRQLRLFGD